ncbi:MAG TPA: TonB-dependent receptor [Prolixibacteraceae bacterium]|nr:TonB-dependent receptor [Prolixibacteraceae bacterium]
MKLKLKERGIFQCFLKVFFVMRITIFFILVSSVFAFSTNSYSQNAKLSLRLRNASVSNVLKAIEEQSEFVFFYQDQLVDLDRNVNIIVVDRTVTEILDQLFKGSDNVYKINDRQIVIGKSEELLKIVSLPVERIFQEVQKLQTIKLTGTIYDEDSKPIPGASVVIKGTTRGTITSVDGAFTIDVEPSAIIVVSFIGYESKEITVGNKTVIHVALMVSNKELDDVTVVAFAKQKKESVIGSITTVKPGELKIPSSNLTTALAGRMSGLISYQRSGEPGKDNAEFFIRGVTTFGYKKDPLILIDNNEVTTQELSRMQPDDIASFSIMKDATATALYGSRGANGVILVTTKEGSVGKAQISVRFEESISKPTSMVKLADPITYMRLHNEAVRTRDPLGITPYSQSKIANTIAGGNPYVYPANDWYKTLFKDQTTNQRLNFNVGGGGKVARYYLAGSVINDNGMLNVDQKNNFNNNIKLKRYMLRSNVNINITKTTEAVVRLQGSFDDYTGPIDGGDGLFQKVMRTNPVLFPAYYKPDAANVYTQHILYGNYDKGQYINPYADMTKGYKDYTTSQMSAQFELKQQLDFITKGLSLRGLFNTNRYAFFDVSRFYNPFYYQTSMYDKAADEYTLMPLNEKSGTEYLGYSEGKKDINSTTYFETALAWNRTFAEKHDLSGLVVYTMREQLFANAGDLQKSLPYRNVGLAGRATYAYDSRYFIEANFGYNGSERFSKKERFGFFPSAGLGWYISNEPFYSEGLKKTISKLKLKATYGLVGNDAIGDENDRFFYLSNVNMDDEANRSSFGTYGNMGGNTLNGVSISRYANDNITWETARKLNLGLEMSFWNELDIQADFFKETRYNILMTRSSIPTTMGLQAATRANVGEAASKGVDISLNYSHSFNKDFWITGLANFTYATSEFIVYEEPNYTGTPWRSHVGLSLNQNWGYVAERLFVDDEEIRNSPVQFGDYKAGDIKYKDINKDGKITEQDMVPLGYPTSPEIVYGFGLSCGWKSFDLSCFFQGLANESFWIDVPSTSPFINYHASDYYPYPEDLDPGRTANNALLQEYADSHWSEDNRNIYALWPRLSETISLNNNQTSSWFMRNGAFLRLKSVEFGYTLPEKITSKAKITNLRVYFSGTNLLTFSKFKMWDPEMGGKGLGYPIQKVYNFGLQLTF